MQKEIKLKEKTIKYILKTSRRARHLRLSIGCDGVLTATKPWWINQGAVENFIAKKAAWILSRIDYFKHFDGRFFKTDKKNYLESKEETKKIVEEKITRFNAFYGFKFNRISIKRQKSRWGSCSRRGNLNFNYKITLFPEDLTDYIVVHELCHLKELNHSKKFWQLVALSIPDYLLRRRALAQFFKK